MMHIGKTLISAIVGTTAMTLFSYIVSESKNKNFREPEVLGQLVERLPNKISNKSAQITGWGTHYAIGILFMLIYTKLLEQTKAKTSLTSGTLLSITSGLTGIMGWKGMFEGHPNPPSKNLKSFFGHLMLAHIVFGIFSASSYKLMNGNKNS
ncbi:MAG: hypothetical protein ACM31G_06455 [Flavobacteriales bacterium]